MDRFGRDLQKMYEENAKQFSHKTVLQLGLRIVSLKNAFYFLNLSSLCKCLSSVPLLCRVQVLWWADLGTAFTWLLFCQLDILEYVHEHEYVHGDIKAANLLLSYKNPNQVFIMHFTPHVLNLLFDNNESALNLWNLAEAHF